MLSRLRLAPLLLVISLGAHAQAPDATPAPPPTPSMLDGELFYQLLLGEFSVQRGDAGVGFSLMLDAARKTGDAQLFLRAVEIALQARSGESALQAARAWSQALPESRDANRYVLQILIGLNRLEEIVAPLRRELALAGERERPLAITLLPRYFARSSDKAAATRAVEEALREHLNHPTTGAAAWGAIGQLRLQSGNADGALEAARRGQALNQQAEEPVLLALALMSAARPAAEGMVRAYLEGQPRPDIRLAYARALLDGQRYAEASAQVRRVTTEQPDHAQAWLILGTLELQDGQLDRAEQALQRFLTLMPAEVQDDEGEQSRALAQAYLSLAQIAEQRQDYAAAERWLSRISSPEDLVRTQSRRAGILARQGRIEEARKLIRDLPERSPAEARLKLSAEVQLLRENKLYQPAYALLAEATQRNPQDYDLLYDQATLAEKLGNMDEMERLLRRIMADKPDYHHAYNALGYSLADRNVRLAEARQLILKALEFAPGDPYINDSLGWVEFRSGNVAEALRILQQAYRSRPDAEIAAHLGEVLWVAGQRDEARAIWREGLLLNAENETLQQTLRRLGVQP